MKAINKRVVVISVKKHPNARLFIQQLQKHHIPIYQLHFQEKQIQFHVAYHHLKKIRQIRRENRVTLSVHYLSPNRILHKDLRMVIGVILLFIVPFLLTQFIWKLDVQADTIELSDEVMLYLVDELAIDLPMQRKNMLSDNQLRQQLMEHFRQFSWIHISKQGSQITISPQLAPKLTKKNSTNQKQHLIASNSGVVTHFEINRGIRQVEPNMTVYKGDTLVSGVVSRGDDHFIVGAEGEVFADYWLETTFSIPKTVELNVLVDTGWNYEWDWQQVKTALQLKSIEPIKSVVRVSPYRMFQKKTETIEEQDIDSFILPLLHEKMMRSLPLKSTIKSEKLLHVTTDDDTVKGKVLFLVNENIAKPHPIDQGE